MPLLQSRSWLLLGACLLMILTASPGRAEPGVPAAGDQPDHSDLEVLTTCQMFIYSSVVLQIYDLSSVEDQSKSRVCGVEKQFTPAQSLEEIARLFAAYGMDKTARLYNLTFDDDYTRQVLELTEIIIKTYQTGYEKALRQQLAETRDNQAFCTAFIEQKNLATD